MDRELFKAVLSKIEAASDDDLVIFRDALYEESNKLKDSSYRADFRKCIRLIEEEMVSRMDILRTTRK